MTSVSTAALAVAIAFVAAPAAAQTAAESEVAGVEEVVVTGTRLQTGFQAPTPVTVIGTAEINAQAPRSITDVVNQIPSIVGSMTPLTRAVQASNGTQGISSPSLRGVGPNRTLVLLDGKRSPSVTQTGETDVEMFPQQLIRRVDVVTGGASAAYGSDALAGVVNFILDHDFTGLKGEIAGGVTTYGDGENYKLSLSTGFRFAQGRGHVLLSGEHYRSQGIFGSQTNTRPERDWLYGAPGIIANPAWTATNGLPQFITVDNFTTASFVTGGLIVAEIRGPLNSVPIVNSPFRGLAFTPEGQPYRFNFGTLERVAAGGIPLFMGGGDWEKADVTGLYILDPKMKRDNLFGRVSFDVSDNVNVYAQGGWSKNWTRGGQSTFMQQGDLIIAADNAFLPADVRAQAAAQGVTGFRVGRVSEGERQGGMVGREVFRFLVGAEGTAQMFGDEWEWEAFAQRGQTDSKEQVTGSRLIDQYTRAMDSVINPANGTPICRVNIDAITTNDDPACVPYNPFRFPAERDPGVDQYAWGGTRPTRWQTFKQTVFAAQLSGSPFSTWAGPVALAVGGEHRKEAAVGRVDAVSQNHQLPLAQQTGLKRWQIPFFPVNGSYTVKEGFAEIAVPLATDQAFAQSLEVNGAVRATDYSVSGGVTTWKAGLTWSPIDDIRLRVTRSRDIRAANLSELFSIGLQSVVVVTDPFRNNESSPQSVQFITGNLDLSPEAADTLGLGVVLQPSFIPGLQVSADYYKISIKDAIGALTAQQIVNLCFAGQADYCGFIERNIGTPVNGLLQISRVRSSFFNLTSQVARGIDFEVSYRMPVERLFSGADGDINMRVFATRFLENRINDGINPPFDFVGDMRTFAVTPQIGGISRWKGIASITYTTQPITAALMARFVSSGTVGGPMGTSNFYIECTSGCPVATTARPTIDNNHVAGAVYFDASLAWRPTGLPASPEVFLSVRNIFNKDPAVLPRGPGGLAYGVRPTNEMVYDVYGRVFRAGVRFEM